MNREIKEAKIKEIQEFYKSEGDITLYKESHRITIFKDSKSFYIISDSNIYPEKITVNMLTYEQFEEIESKLKDELLIYFIQQVDNIDKAMYRALEIPKYNYSLEEYNNSLFVTSSLEEIIPLSEDEIKLYREIVAQAKEEDKEKIDIFLSNIFFNKLKEYEISKLNK